MNKKNAYIISASKSSYMLESIDIKTNSMTVTNKTTERNIPN